MKSGDIKKLMYEDDKFLYQCLITLYNFQTYDEQQFGMTNINNKRGFNAVDSEILTSFSKQLLTRGYLTDNQRRVLKNKLPKYCGQLESITEDTSLVDVEVNEQPEQVQSNKLITLEIRKAENVNGEYAVFAKFDYNAKIVSIFRGFSDRWYHNDTKEWELPAKSLNDLLKSLNGYSYTLNGKELLNKKEIKLPKDYEFKTKPFKHQEEAIQFGLNNEKWLLGDTMGLGKTKVAIDLACIKKQQKSYKHCLIICGVNGLKWNWANEIETHSNEEYCILGKRGKKDIANTDKLEDLENIDMLPYFIVTNVETLRYKTKTGLQIIKKGKPVDEYAYPITDKLVELCENNKINMIVFDEFHTVKNPNSDQGEQILRLKTEYMLALTGTPLMNSPLDLFCIMKWLGYEKHSFYSFKNHYCIMGGYGGYQVVGYKNLEEIQAVLKEIMLRRLKEEVFDLPEKLYVDEYVDLTPKQKQLYDEVKMDIKMNIDKIAISNNPLAELIRMRQATGYTGILSSSVKESAKFDRVLELVEEAKANNQKVVIFTNWVQVAEPLHKLLRDKKYYGHIIDGEVDTFTRQQYVDEFQTDDKVNYMIGTVGAMGTGITLTAGTIEIFMDEPWNMALKEQAVDRCHRIGTKNNVTIYTLMAKNTIDERIHNIVENKGLMSDAIVDGKINIDKKELLEYLID